MPQPPPIPLSSSRRSSAGGGGPPPSGSRRNSQSSLGKGYGGPPRGPVARLSGGEYDPQGSFLNRHNLQVGACCIQEPPCSVFSVLRMQDLSSSRSAKQFSPEQFYPTGRVVLTRAWLSLCLLLTHDLLLMASQLDFSKLQCGGLMQA